MQAAGKPNAWQEFDGDQPTGNLTLRRCGNDHLRGEWRAPNGRKTLALEAKPLAAREAYLDRAGQGYGDTRLAALKPLAKRADSAKFPYQLLRAPGVDTITGARLLGPGTAAVNRSLLREFPRQFEQHLDTLVQGDFARAAYYHEFSMEVVDWNRKFVVTTYQTAGYYGGPHPNYASGGITYRLDTGEPEALAAWLKEEYRSESGVDIAPDSPLGRRLLETYREGGDGDECLAYLNLAGINRPSPAGIGFATWVPHAALPCEEEILLSYPAVSPFLSEYGKANARFFREPRE